MKFCLHVPTTFRPLERPTKSTRLPWSRDTRVAKSVTRARSVNRKLLRRTCHRSAVAVHSHHAVGSTAGACNGIATRATTTSGRDRSAAERTKSIWLCNRR
jgi:hypothetical protein